MVNLWVVPADLGGTYTSSVYAEEACQMASNILWAMSGRRYNGSTTVTERYITSINAFRYQGASARNFFPHMMGGYVYNVPSDDWNDSAYQSDGTSALSRIRLRGKPVREIHLVRSMYNGQIISPDAYYLAEHSEIRAYKGVPWPPGNLEVTYSYGAAIPVAGKMAAKLFAIELIKFWEGDDCALPDRVTSISRQGVSYTVLDNQDFLENMRIGIYAIDLFIKTANPAKALAPSKVFNVDVPRARRAAPSRPVTLPISSTYDVALTKTNNFTQTLVLSAAGYLATYYNDPDYKLVLEASSWAGYTKKIYDHTASSWTGTVGSPTVTLAFDYATTYEAIGPNDPGTWTLYVEEIATGAQIATLQGNLQIKKVVSSEVDPVSGYGSGGYGY